MDSCEMADLVEQIKAVNDGRSIFYRMLSHLFFKELTQEQIEHLSKVDLSGMTGDDALIAEGYEDIHRSLRHMNTGMRQKLAVDYAHTFLAAGNYETFAATPYESVFTSELGLLMQEARDEVYKMYCAEHIQPEESLHTPEDHVSFEFEFMATMLERMNEALDAGDTKRALECARTAQKFHREHQLNWIDDLCDVVMDVAETQFYRGVSKVTRGYIHMETDVIDDEVEMLEEMQDERAA